MPRTVRTFLTLIIAGVPMAGCAPAAKDAGFGDVQREVNQRAAYHVQWNRGTAEDEQAMAAVGKLLQAELGPEEAVQIALLNNRRLQGTYQELGIAQAALVQAGLLRNPVFDIERRFHGGGNDHAMVIGAVDDFLHILLIPLRKQIASADLERAKWQVTSATLELAGRVKIAFFHLQADEQLLEMRKTVLESTEASYELAQRMSKAGNLNELDLLREQAACEQAKLNLSTSERAVIEDRERLNSLMGLWGMGVRWKVAVRLADVPDQEMNVEHLERRAIERNVDLAAAYQKLKVSAGQVGLSRTVAAIGQVQLGAHAEWEPDGLATVGPALSLSVPIFDQGQAVASAQKARFVRLWNDYTAQAVEIRSDVRAKRDILSIARQQAEFYRKVVLPLRQKVTEQALLRYNAMQMTNFELLQTKRDQIDAGLQYIAVLRDYWTVRTELEHALAGHVLSHEMPARLGDMPSGDMDVAGDSALAE
jgi:cobalt-zinc-cadmium efflux system outer membrane protein